MFGHGSNSCTHSGHHASWCQIGKYRFGCFPFLLSLSSSVDKGSHKKNKPNRRKGYPDRRDWTNTRTPRLVTACWFLRLLHSGGRRESVGRKKVYRRGNVRRHGGRSVGCRNQERRVSNGRRYYPYTRMESCRAFQSSGGGKRCACGSLVVRPRRLHRCKIRCQQLQLDGGCLCCIGSFNRRVGVCA